MNLAPRRLDTNFDLAGLEDAPAVVLAHGLATNLSMWDPVMPWLEDAFRVIRYDARGHGATPAGEGRFFLEDLAGDVIALLDHLQVERAHFVGLSMGGMTGMGLALDHPDRLRRLVVCDARADAPGTYRASWNDRIAKVREGGVTALVEPTLARWVTDGFKANAEGMAFMRDMIRGTSAEGYIGCAQALKELDYKRRLPELRVPTLFLVGDQDAGAPPEVMRAMHEETPGSAFVTIAGAGHISVVEQPQSSGAAIREFLGA